MKKNLLLVIHLVLFSCLLNAQNQLPTVVSGKIIRIGHFHSKFITPRNVDIWLPDGYCDTVKYAVLYMHDGQMLFDSAITWNHQAWNADDVAAALIKTGNTRNFIIVGIWNGGVTRHSDYFPQKPLKYLSKTETDTLNAQLRRSGRTTEVFVPNSDNYLKFLVKELKPYIDKHFSVLPDRQNTFIAGSSMGGLISWYALCEYPKVFGGAACMSTHWPGTFTVENNPIPDAFIKYLKKKLPDPATHKLYFDCGDQTLDALYPPIQQKVDDLMKSKSYNDKNWLTKFFTGENHSEKAWNKRLTVPLVFLLGN